MKKELKEKEDELESNLALLRDRDQEIFDLQRLHKIEETKTYEEKETVKRLQSEIKMQKAIIENYDKDKNKNMKDIAR